MEFSFYLQNLFSPLFLLYNYHTFATTTKRTAMETTASTRKVTAFRLDTGLLERLKASGRSADADHKAHIVEFEMLEDWFFVVIIGQDNLSNLGNS